MLKQKMKRQKKSKHKVKKDLEQRLYDKKWRTMDTMYKNLWSKMED